MMYISETTREFFSLFKMRFVHLTLKSQKGYQFDIDILNFILLENLAKFLYGDPFGWTVSLMRKVDGRLLVVPISRTIYLNLIFYSKVIITLFVPNLIILLFKFITRVVKILFSFFLSSTKMSRFCAIKLKRANFMCPCDLLVNCSNQ